MSESDLPSAGEADAVIAVIRAELTAASPSGRQLIWEAHRVSCARYQLNSPDFAGNAAVAAFTIKPRGSLLSPKL